MLVLWFGAVGGCVCDCVGVDVCWWLCGCGCVAHCGGCEGPGRHIGERIDWAAVVLSALFFLHAMAQFAIGIIKKRRGCGANLLHKLQF